MLSAGATQISTDSLRSVLYILLDILAHVTRAPTGTWRHPFLNMISSRSGHRDPTVLPTPPPNHDHGCRSRAAGSYSFSGSVFRQRILLHSRRCGVCVVYHCNEGCAVWADMRNATKLTELGAVAPTGSAEVEALVSGCTQPVMRDGHEIGYNAPRRCTPICILLLTDSRVEVDQLARRQSSASLTDTVTRIQRIRTDRAPMKEPRRW